MKKFYLLLFAGFISFSCFSQVIFSCIVKDADTGEPIPGVSVVGKGDFVHTTTKNDGIAKFLIKPGNYIIQFSSIGYEFQEVEIEVRLTAPDSLFPILMKKSELSEVIIYSTRTDSRIENTPTKVEVLGAKELDEESSIRPSHIASLLGKVPGIQSQQTSAVTGNVDLRIRGLPGNYTQILRDGMPLFGGFSSGFARLDIPCMDIEQIEIIKGASSAFYGGGAIAGMINIISKKPRAGKPERILLLNQSTLQGSDFNIYLSERKGKVGYTFFIGAAYQKQKDINNDGFSDAARQEAVFLHPSFYFYLNEKNTVSLSIKSVYDDRKGGDMDILSGYYSNIHQFFIQNQILRNTLGINWEKKISTSEKYNFKIGTSSFNRDISGNVFGMKAKQFSYYAEAYWLKKISNHDIVASLNLNGENLKKGLPDSTLIGNYKYFTLGMLAQDDWRIHPKFTIGTTLRSDFHNKYGTFILPAISLLYKINPEISMRMGGGLGYRIPTIISGEVDERDFPKLKPLQNVKAERSASLNWDFNYKKKFGKLELEFNQSFFFTQVKRPLVMQKTISAISYFNAVKPITTTGSETSVQVNFAGIEANFSYTITDAKKKYDPLHPYLELSIRDYLAGSLSYSFPKYVHIAIHATRTGSQYLEDGTRTPLFSQIGGLIRFDVGRLSFVLNCDNYYDYRQTKKESIYIPPYTNPSFKQIWAPLDGRVANLSVRIKF